MLVVIFGLFVRFRSCDLWVYYKSYWLMVIGSTRSRSEWLWVSRFQLWNVILKTKCVWIKWGWVDFVIIVFSFTLTPHTFPHGHLSLIRLSVENQWLKSFGVSGMLFLFFIFSASPICIWLHRLYSLFTLFFYFLFFVSYFQLGLWILVVAVILTPVNFVTHKTKPFSILWFWRYHGNSRMHSRWPLFLNKTALILL